MNREEIRRHYSENRPEIDSRLEEFRGLREALDERLFKELCFVIFTSQSSAEDAWSATEKLDEKGLLLDPEKEAIESILVNHGIQYEARKAEFLEDNLCFLSQPTFSDPSSSIKLRSRIKPDNLEKCREWLVDNVKGLSWKGASHFLRNIGYGNNFAILSSHTVSVLFDLDVLKSSEPPKNRSQYLDAERKVQEFSEEIGIDIQALDLVLWSYRTGKVFK
jgi:N-glycosylase/DNA lyase